MFKANLGYVGPFLKKKRREREREQLNKPTPQQEGLQQKSSTSRQKDIVKQDIPLLDISLMCLI